METLSVRNRMSAVALKEKEGVGIDFVRNPKTGKMFFSCGSKAGYISPRVLEAHNNNTLDVKDLQYAECKKPNSDEWVSCLMMKGSNNNVVKSY